MSKFFINRPIVAMVISIVLVLVGALTVLRLPVAQFPKIAPPEIQILATYVGADAQTLEQAVATPLEQQMNGVDNMNYMYSLNATGNSTTSLIVARMTRYAASAISPQRCRRRNSQAMAAPGDRMVRRRSRTFRRAPRRFHRVMESVHRRDATP